MESVSKIIFFLILSFNIKQNTAQDSFISVLEERLENKLGEFTNYAAKSLEEFNDDKLGNSEIGKMISYNVLKTKFGIVQRAEEGKGKSLKKMSMALIPLIFHVGATSTWLVLTSLMAAKSVGLGIILLVFKIAVSSAKVSSFFTSMKTAKHNDRHHDWSWTQPHYEHHATSYTPSGSSAYNPEAHYVEPTYKAAPTGYKTHEDTFEDTGLHPLRRSDSSLPEENFVFCRHLLP